MPTTRKKAPRRAAARSRAKPAAPTVMIPVERLAPGGPLAGLVTRPQRGRQFERSFVGADTARIAGALAEADRGFIAALQDHYSYMRDRDPRVDAVCRTRVLAITGRPYTLKPPLGEDDNPEAVEIAERVARIITRIRPGAMGTGDTGQWPTALGQIADGTLRGMSVSELEWGVSPEGWHAPRALHWRHPNRFRYDEDHTLRLHDGGSGDMALGEYGRDKFVVHSPSSGRAAYPMQRGALRGCVFPSLFKRSVIKFWIKGTERWGQPLPVLKLPVNASAELIAASNDLLNQMATNWNAALHGGIELVQVPGSGALNPAIYDTFADFCNVEIAVTVLGNNLNVEIQGGSFAAAETAAAMRYDILASDLAEIDETITQQIIEPVVRYNWPGAPVPVYVSELRAQTGFTVEDVREGICTEDEYRSSKGYEPKPDGLGAEYRRPLAAVPAQLDPLGGAAPASPFAMSQRSRPIVRVTNNSTSPTSAPSRSVLASELYKRLAGSGRSPSTGS
ncbi:MAG: DUF935 family protein [Deltaproteobacteria bacterium]|nr:DUF935 family protein [Deltaproteobacteria bacterium]